VRIPSRSVFSLPLSHDQRVSDNWFRLYLSVNAHVCHLSNTAYLCTVHTVSNQLRLWAMLVDTHVALASQDLAFLEPSSHAVSIVCVAVAEKGAWKMCTLAWQGIVGPAHTYNSCIRAFGTGGYVLHMVVSVVGVWLRTWTQFLEAACLSYLSLILPLLFHTPSRPQPTSACFGSQLHNSIPCV